MSLTVRLYLWFLFAIGVLVAAVAGILSLTSSRELSQRFEQNAVQTSELQRDIVSLLLSSGTSPEIITQKLRAFGHRNAIRIERADGSLLIATSAETPAPSDEDRKCILAGETVRAFGGRAPSVGLPIMIGAERGVFYATAVSPPRPTIPRRDLIGIAVVIALGWLMCWPLAQSLTAPINQIGVVAERFGAGDLSARISAKRADEIGRLGKSFNHMADAIARLLHDQRRLLADVSHELRTPLARLRLRIALARQKGESEDLNRMDEQCVALGDLIEELLSYSRLGAAAYELRAEHKSLRDEVGRVLLPFTDTPAPGATLQLVGGDDAEVTIDPRLFQRGLANVLKNAVTHAPPDSRVLLQVRLVDALAEVVVDDLGPGVSAADQNHIFEPFYRGHDAESGTGHGLGLAIARRCIQAQGGDIHAEPNPAGRGLRVVLSLPLARA